MLLASVLPLLKLRHDITGLTSIAVMVVWFCHGMIFSGEIPFFRDLTTYFYPIKFSVFDAFLTRELPLWDHHMASGFPVLAGLQSAVFYPPTIIFWALPFLSAIRFTFVFHYAVAAAGAYVLLRSWKVSIYVRLLGATLFAFAGTIVSLSNLLNHFQSAVWLPWLLYSWERALATASWRNIVKFSFVALCQALAGSPEIFLLSLCLVSLDTLRLIQKEPSLGLTKIAALAFAAGFIIMGLGMVQWLPTAELLVHSRRDQAIQMSEVLSWSLQPMSLIGLLLPTLEPDPSLTVGIRLLFSRSVPFLLSHYIGVIGVLGLCSWMYSAPSKERVIILVAVSGSALLAFGSFTPVYPFLYEWLPPFRIMRFPEKYWFVTFCLIVFTVARGMQRMEDQPGLGAWWKIATAIFASLLGTYMFFRLSPEILAEFLERDSVKNLSSADPKAIAAMLFILEKQIALSGGIAALLIVYRFGWIRHSLLWTLFVVAAFFDLSSVTKPLHFLRDQRLLTNVPRILNQPPSDRARLFYYPPSENLHPSVMRVGGSPTYEKATEIALNNLLPNAGRLFGFEYFQDIDALGRRSYTDFLMFINSLPERERGNLLRVLNVQYVLAFHAIDLPELRLVQQFPEHFSALYEVKTPVSRTYIAERALYERDARSTLERMASPDFDPARDVILDVPLAQKKRNVFSASSSIRLYENRRVLIDAQLSAPGVLVLVDAFYPGWKVFVNGKEQIIRRANYLFRGVELPAGPHEVEFVYDPLSFKIGGIVSVSTLALIISVLAVGSVRRKFVRRPA